ncbi:MAG: phosphoribosylformylglycinamidine synthase subunit PurS [Sulfolobales archaeon]|nr:phosphoribosylformylglycinamidine synthase subunit PurS [Sulfolobales archaeon]MDW8082883.1 phosphoribosylformylglycinamidine synthase subunit PurS [Sulfolobales archaeon]
MGLYRVVAVVSYRRGLKDPEAETIYRDLILRHGYSAVKEVRVGKQFTLLVEAESPERAVNYVKEICDKLMIYNPVIHELYVTIHA